MGVVFEARQKGLGRKVALKVLPSQLTLDSGALERFRREAASAAKLRHPGIAGVHVVGEVEGCPWFAMELVEGPSLEKVCRRLRGRKPETFEATLLEEAGFERGSWLPASPVAPPFASVAAWGAALADALEAAHRAKVLHRDLKPSNVLLREDGAPVLVDFGLARDLNQAGLTRTGDAVGTPSYMAPEQARGSYDLDRRVDVYGLGATLYECVTLKPPFEGRDPANVMRSILEEEVRDPRRFNPACPDDLAAILLKCLAKRPEDRFASARDLAISLRRFLQGEQVGLRAPGMVHRLQSGIRRRRAWISASLAGAVFVTMAGAGFIWWQGSRRAMQGGDALATALDALRRARPDRAAARLREVLQRLAPERIRGDWVRALLGSFATLYARGEYERAGSLLRRAAGPFADDPAIVEALSRAEGRARLRFRLEPPSAKVLARRIRPDASPGPVAVLASGGFLPLGEWRLHVRAPGCLDGIYQLRLKRDQDLKLVLRALPKSEVPDGAAWIPGSGDGRMPPFLLMKREVTGKEYSAFLKTIVDPVRRAVFRPLDWEGDDPPAGKASLPVGGVPVQGAEAFARSRGGRLPAEDELAFAGNLGLPWRFPWGMEWDPKRIAHRRNGLHGPAMGGGRPGGRACNGVEDLVGNLAEWAFDGDSGIVVFGGAWNSPLEDLGLERSRPRSPPRPASNLGFRVAWSMPFPRIAGEEGDGLEEEWTSGIARGRPQERTDLSFGRDGVLEVTDRITGTLAREDRGIRQIAVPLGRADLALSTSPVVESPEGAVLVQDGDDPHRSLVQVLTGKGLVGSDGRLRVRVLRRGFPKEALRAEPGGFVLQLPLDLRPAVRRFVFLELPAESRLLKAEPAPVRNRIEGRVRRVAWLFEGTARDSGRRWLDLVFLLDGVAEGGFSLGSAFETLQVFTRSWNRGEIEGGIERVVEAGSFTFGAAAEAWPGLRPVMRRMPDEVRPGISFEATRLLSGIGPLLRIEAVLDGRIRNPLGVGPWIFLLERSKGRDWHLLDFRPRGGHDAGTVSGRAYRAPFLGLSFEWPAFWWGRPLSGRPGEVQVELRPRAKMRVTGGGREVGAEAGILILGRKTRGPAEGEGPPSLDREISRMRAGEDLGFRVSSRRALPVGDAEGEILGEECRLVRDWIKFRKPRYRKERRLLFRKGERLLLILAWAESEDREAAGMVFDRRVLPDLSSIRGSLRM